LKKIVFLSNSYTIQGGGERSLVQLIEYIKDKYEIFVYVKREGELSKALHNLGVKVFFSELSWSRKIKKQISNYINLFKVYLAVKKIKPNLIYVNSGDINPFGVRLSRLLNVNIITHIRDVFDFPKKDKYLFHKSNAIIADSNIVKEMVSNFNNKVEIIYNGIDKNKFKFYTYEEKKVKKQSLFGDFFLVANIGTIVEKKGFLEFVEVANKICKVLKDIKFLIIGSPKPKEELFLANLKERIKIYNLENRICFMGFIEEIDKILPLIDILLFPTRKEAFGRVIIEAFASGVPVISTYSGGPQEIIENRKDGFLVKVGDIQGMYDAVIELYRNKDLYEYIRKNAYKKFLENFTIDNIAQKITRIIENLSS